MALSVGGKLVQTPQPAGLAPLQMVDRNDLHRILHDHAVAAGVPFEYDKRLVRVEEDGAGVTAHFADGSTAPADVLIGADGVRSTVRGLIDPADPGPDYTGMIGFGAIIDNDLGLEPETMTFAFGKRAYYLYGALDENKIMWGANLPHKDYLSLTAGAGDPGRATGCGRCGRPTRDDSPGGEFARRTTAETSGDHGGAAHHAAGAALVPGPDGPGRRRGARAVQQLRAGRLAGDRELDPAGPLPARSARSGVGLRRVRAAAPAAGGGRRGAGPQDQPQQDARAGGPPDDVAG